MSKVTGWVSLASELAPALHGQTAPEQRRRVAIFAEQCGLMPDTMRRMVRAWDYAVTRIRSENMRISDVNGAFIAVEALERLGRKSPETAARIGRAVLTGEYGYRDVVRISRDLREEDALRPLEINWDQFFWNLYRTLYGSAPGSYSFDPAKDGYSELAKRLNIDVEFNVEEYKRAVFLSPSFPFSEGSKRPIEDHLARAFMSLAYYVETTFIVITDAEEHSVRYFVDLCSKNFRKKMIPQFSMYRYESSTDTLSKIFGHNRS